MRSPYKYFLKLIESGANDKEDDSQKKDNQKQEENSSEDNEQQDDEDDDSLNVSLAAMEEKLKPKVLNDFNDITKLFKKLQNHSNFCNPFYFK